MPDKLEVTYRKVEDLIPYARNARTHSDEQVARIASSIKEFGWTNPIIIDGENGIVAGHGRTLAARKLGLEEVPCIELKNLTETQKRAYILADNRLALDAGWDNEMLALELGDLKDAGVDLELTGFSDAELDELLAVPTSEETEEKQEPEAGEPEGEPVTKLGDIWILGGHRVMCGDSTSFENVDALVGDEKADFLHADPPYGMGKASEGVANDNIYRENLVQFQLEWLTAWRPHTIEKINIAIWGNAEEVWRLWYGGLNALEKEIRFVNEIVWSKPTQAGLNNADAMALTQCERCLILQTGKQFIGNVNADDFPEEWKPILSELQAMAEAAGLTAKKVRELTDVSMYGHWFTTSQFALIPEKHYETLAKEYPEAFKKPWKELKSAWSKVCGKGRNNLTAALERAYFDARTDSTDVWEFITPMNDDRPDHPTPKSLPMMQRMMKMCCPENGLVLEPFGGSGQTLLAAEATGRRCFTMELQPKYCDMIVERWQKFTGLKATSPDGVLFDDFKEGKAERPVADDSDN